MTPRRGSARPWHRLLRRLNPWAERDWKELLGASQALADPVVLIDETGRVVHANPAVLPVFGWRPDELIGHNVSELAAEPDRSRHDEYLARYRESDVPRALSQPREVTAAHRDGSQLPVRLTTTEITARGRRFFLGTMQDLRAARRAEEDLSRHHAAAREEARSSRLRAESEALLARLRHIGFAQRTLPELLDDALAEILEISWLRIEGRGGVFAVEPESQTLELVAQRGLAAPLLSQCARVPFGHCLCGRAARTRTIQHASCVDDRHEIRFEGMAPHGHYNVPLISREHVVGVLVLYLPAGSPRSDRETRLLGKIAETLADVIVRSRFEAELRRERAAAVEASRAKSRFLAAMSQEIRAPLSAVVENARLLLETDLSADQREYAESSCRCGESLVELIDDILEYSRIQSGHMRLETSDFDLRTLVDDVVAAVAAGDPEKDVELIADIRYGVPVALTGDPTRLRQVLTNLIANAVRFTECGEVLLSVEPAGEIGRRTRLLFTVRDTGIGIDPDRLGHIFDPIGGDDQISARRIGGRGPGLALVKDLAELLGGEIEAESAPGQGSTFRVVLPFMRQPRQFQTDSISRGDLSGLRMLVAEGNSTLRKVIGRWCATWNVVASCVDSADAALEALISARETDQGFDVLVCDWRLANGEPPLLERLAADEYLATLPVILLAREKPPSEGLDRGAWLPRPVRRSQLFDALTRALERAGADRKRCAGLRQQRSS